MSRVRGCSVRASILSVVLKLASPPPEVEAKRTSFPPELSAFTGIGNVQFTITTV